MNLDGLSFTLVVKSVGQSSVHSVFSAVLLPSMGNKRHHCHHRNLFAIANVPAVMAGP